MNHTQYRRTALRSSPLMVLMSLLMCASSALALDAASANSLAQAIITDLGRTKGFCAVSNCGDGELAFAFMRNSTMKVHAMDADTANVRATSQRADGAGYVAPSFYADKGTLSQMPYADRFADLIVITNLTDAALAGVPYAEIQRALCPGGKAWIGRATSEGAGITQTALQNWINAASKTRSSAIVSTSNGTWAVITGRELSGIDVWTRHAYDASGIRYSRDSVSAFPWLPQLKLKPYRLKTGTIVTSAGRMYMVYQTNDDYGISVAQPTWLRAYSIYNGELLWSRNVGSDALGDLGADPIAAYQQDVYLKKSNGWLQLNGATGAEIGTVATPPSAPLANIPMPTNGTGGCGPYSASINATYNNSGGPAWDFIAKSQRAFHYYKPPCGIVGQVISNGFDIAMAPSCQCGGQFKGTKVEAAAGSFQFDRNAAADGSDRIERGPAYGAVSVQVHTDSLDWTTHRSTVNRSGRSLAQVPNTSAVPPLMWNHRPVVNCVTEVTNTGADYRTDQEPTPPVVANGYTFFGGSDGLVRCINNGSGQTVWSYRTGGRVYATPTVWDGCVYAGSGDGYAYCIEAHTGRLVWRFRAAPVDRRINVFGYLTSTWPVLSGVMINAGKAYFVGGMQCEYGAHVYCVDAKSAALVWQNNTASTAMKAYDRLGYSPCGYLTVAKNKLVAANNIGSQVSFDLATGVKDPIPSWMGNFMNGYPPDNANFGREVGFINNQYVMTGGEQMWRDHAWRNQSGYHELQTGYNQIDNTGFVYPKIYWNWTTNVTPAWDDRDVFSCMNGSWRLESFTVADFCARLDAKVASTPQSTWRGGSVNPDYEFQSTTAAAPAWWPTAAWSRQDIMVNAIAAAQNVLVAAYRKAGSPVPELADWYLGALNRATGTTIWETKLPDIGTGLKGEPLWQGLAIDRNGYIIVAQRNGNMLCYGGGTVSVASNSPRMQTPASTAAATPVAPWRLSSAAMAPSSVPATNSSATPTTPVSSASTQQSATVASTAQQSFEQTTAVEQIVARDSSDLVLRDGMWVHGTPPSERAATALFKPRDMAWHPDRELVTIASVSASSQARSGGPSKTTDHDLTSRWTPLASGTQSITYDLGVTRTVNAATIVWYSAAHTRTPFTIETSSDGASFERVDDGTLSGRGTSTTLRSFVATSARFVRIALVPPTTGPALSLYEVGIHGGDCDRTALSK